MNELKKYEEENGLFMETDTAERIAIEINTIRRRAVQDALQSAMEIGRLLIEAKEAVPFGEWGDWLRDNFEYSTSNANNLMRLYTERSRMAQLDMFGDNDANIFEGLSLSQAVSLLRLPPAERKTFVESHDMENLSVREMNREIKDAEELRKAAEEAEERIRDAEQKAEAAEALVRAATAEKEKAIKELEAEKNKSEDERKKIEKEIKDKAKADVEKKTERIIREATQKANEDVEKKVKEAAEKAAEEERKKAAAQLDDAIKQLEEARAKVAEAKAAAKVAQSPFLIRFKEHLDTFKAEYKAMTDIAEEAKKEDPEVGEKLTALLEKVKDVLN